MERKELNEERLTRSVRATHRFAARLAAHLKAGDAVSLTGPLGAGKTCFVRGLARALGIPKEVPITSPTFTVMNSYEQGRLPLHHFDLYRLEDLDELEATGYRDFVGGDGVVVVEWADRIPDALPRTAYQVVFEDLGPNARRITISRAG